MLNFFTEVVLGGFVSKYFSIENAKASIQSTLEAKEEFASAGVPLPEALAINHVVMQWVFGQPDIMSQTVGKIKTATAENISLINELWKLCASKGINLTTEQKIGLFQNFLDD